MGSLMEGFWMDLRDGIGSQLVGGTWFDGFEES